MSSKLSSLLCTTNNTPHHLRAPGNYTEYSFTDWQCYILYMVRPLHSAAMMQTSPSKSFTYYLPIHSHITLHFIHILPSKSFTYYPKFHSHITFQIIHILPSNSNTLPTKSFTHYPTNHSHITFQFKHILPTKSFTHYPTNHLNITLQTTQILPFSFPQRTKSLATASYYI
jgi:hypothetical protein